MFANELRSSIGRHRQVERRRWRRMWSESKRAGARAVRARGVRRGKREEEEEQLVAQAIETKAGGGEPDLAMAGVLCTRI